MMTATEIAEGDRLLEQAQYALASYREFRRQYPDYVPTSRDVVLGEVSR